MFRTKLKTEYWEPRKTTIQTSHKSNPKHRDTERTTSGTLQLCHPEERSQWCDIQCLPIQNYNRCHKGSKDYDITVKRDLEGTEIPGRNLSCDTAEFGVISQKEVTETLKHVFGAKTKKTGGVKHLVFNTGNLQRLGKVYDLSVQVEVLTEEESRPRSRDDRDNRSTW
jgi:hypothetical protein